MASHPWRNGMRAALLTLLMAALWATFAPAQAGGQVTYVIVAGASMNPALRRGDLVIARQAEDYQVGDIVAYRHPTIGPVIHRILAEQEGAFTLKGDANAWVNSYQPMAADMLGKAWIRLPGVGRMLTWLRQPLGLGVVALLISLLVVTSVVPVSKPERKQGQEKSVRRPGLELVRGCWNPPVAGFRAGDPQLALGHPGHRCLDASREQGNRAIHAVRAPGRFRLHGRRAPAGLRRRQTRSWGTRYTCG